MHLHTYIHTYIHYLAGCGHVGIDGEQRRATEAEVVHPDQLLIEPHVEIDHRDAYIHTYILLKLSQLVVHTYILLSQLVVHTHIYTFQFIHLLEVRHGRPSSRHKPTVCIVK